MRAQTYTGGCVHISSCLGSGAEKQMKWKPLTLTVLVPFFCQIKLLGIILQHADALSCHENLQKCSAHLLIANYSCMASALAVHRQTESSNQMLLKRTLK